MIDVREDLIAQSRRIADAIVTDEIAGERNADRSRRRNFAAAPTSEVIWPLLVAFSVTSKLVPATCQLAASA